MAATPSRNKMSPPASLGREGTPVVPPRLGDLTPTLSGQEKRIRKTLSVMHSTGSVGQPHSCRIRPARAVDILCFDNGAVPALGTRSTRLCPRPPGGHSASALG